MKQRVVHYDDMQIFGGINLCGVRGTWHGTTEVTKVTCKNCQRYLTYWLIKNKVLVYGRPFPNRARTSTHFAAKQGRTNAR